MPKNWIIILFAHFTLFSAAQVPGNKVVISGANQYIDFHESLKNNRSVTFWIKLTADIDQTLSQEAPILVRDENDPGQSYGADYGIYFGKQGTSEAGHLVFLRGNSSGNYWIKSDTNSWAKDQWFHVACVIDPQQGMKMYVNGVLQQETDPSTFPVFTAQEGRTGSVFLNKWGTSSGYSMLFEMDELRFYRTALSETNIREDMCKTIAPSASMEAYYNFDYTNAVGFPSINGSSHYGTTYSFGGSNTVISDAPIGDVSTFDYNLSSAAVLSLNYLGVDASFDSIYSMAQGAHVYGTTLLPPIPAGQQTGFIGIWFTSENADYRANLDFSASTNDCDSCSELRSRDRQSYGFSKRQLFADNCTFTLPSESPGNLKHREEYRVTFKIELKGGLEDSIWACEGEYAQLSPRVYPDASYLWNDGDTNINRSVKDSGMYVVKISRFGCHVLDTVFVNFKPVPKFQLPNDTSICIGDTLILAPPDYGPEAEYNWGNGLHTGPKFRMYEEGTISLTITLGDCSWTDEITVKLIKNFPLWLGPDTTACLGDVVTLKATPGLNYLWSNGHTGQSISLFNQPQKVWVQVWNECFTKTDTIIVDYEECDCHIYMANSFTPNNDGINDFFKPVTGCNYEQFELHIYDRWGKQVFYSESADQSWDGNYRGKPCPMGAYTYQMRHKKYTQHDMSPFERGTITLIR